MERRKKNKKTTKKKKKKTVVIQSQIHSPPLGLALNWCSNLIKYSHTNLPQVGFEFRSLGCKPIWPNLGKSKNLSKKASLVFVLVNALMTGVVYLRLDFRTGNPG